MPWHVIAQIGPDEYLPDLATEEPRFVASIDKPGSRYSITQQLLSQVLEKGLIPSETAMDLVHLAVIVYTADLRIWRGYSEDGWAREITLHVPVSQPGMWNEASPVLSELLSFLTGDHWTVLFRPKVPNTPMTPGEAPVPPPQAVCLFSGGLDSFVGALDLLATGAHVVLVGHYGTKRDQTSVFEALKAKYDPQMLPFWFYVLPPKTHKDQEVESTMRARSFLFLSLGTAVATALAPGAPLYVPENGFISLNIPLTFARAGTHSTRTTHPYTLDLFRRVLAALGINVILKAPYRFVTKGEMLRDCKDQEILKAAVHNTISCSSPQAGRFHGRPVGQHCGYCVPCIIRRAALHAVGLDCEPCHLDVRDCSIEAKTAAGADKRAFLMAITRVRQMTSLEITSEILSVGPMNAGEIDDLAAVFKRGLEEVDLFLKSCV
ncbi:MAG TPA: Qat anti-phage system QueC-like protein QatC [Bryobacteraceae bacterium]